MTPVAVLVRPAALSHLVVAVRKNRITCLVLLLALLGLAGATLPAQAQPRLFGAGPPVNSTVTGTRFSQVPNFVGLSLVEARALAVKSGLTPRFVGATDPAARVGSQRPAFRAPIFAAGMTVVLQMQAVAPPSPEGRVPNFIGLRRDDADALARQSGLAPRFFGATDAEARVGNQRPESGSPIFRTGMLIGLQMTAPPPQEQVPNFVGLARDEAIALARNRGLAARLAGATGVDAHVGSQQPVAGTPIVRIGMAILLQMEAPLPLPQRRMPNFVGLRRDQARALADKSGLVPRFAGTADPDAQVDSQRPEFGTPISRPDMPVLLQMEALPLQGQVPNFVGLGRGEASDLAKQSGLAPEFAGAMDTDARVGNQRPRFGTPIFRTGMLIRLQMEAPPPPPVPPVDTGTGSTSTPGSAPSGSQSTPPNSSAPSNPPVTGPASAPPAPPVQSGPLPGSSATVPPGTRAPSQGTPQGTSGESCASRDLPSWLVASVSGSAVTTCPESTTRNWLLLLVIAGALTGGAVVLSRVARVVRPRVHVDPHMTGSARVVTRTVSNGLAAMTVSLEPADGPHIDVRYLLKHDARPEPDAVRITISAEGEKDDA
ncbi:MAG TPA: PASTA domain-containing protein [Rhizomicrobium sp.]|nr:PASTA domain-containing protein [Rhizomicrobium sp.]